MVPHLGKTVSPKGHKESAIRKKIKTLFNPLLLQSNIQVNFEMFYQKYAFDIRLKAYSIHHCFGLTTDVFSMHLIFVIAEQLRECFDLNQVKSLNIKAPFFMARNAH